jgi:alpha-tubulin suppressor-like RCC1 family protein
MNKNSSKLTVALAIVMTGCSTLNITDVAEQDHDRIKPAPKTSNFASEARGASRATISGGLFHTLAVTVDGHVLSWGANEFRQLGIASSQNANLPAQVLGPENASRLEGVVAVAAGGMGQFGQRSHSLALRSDGTVVSWGDNSFGQLGTGSAGSAKRPVPVSGATTIVAIAAGGIHSLALKANGTVLSWGGNTFGQLGVPFDGACFDLSRRRTTPVLVSGLTNIVAIAAGGTHSLALRADGKVFAWGAGSDGQLGGGTFTDCQRQPELVSSLSAVTNIAAGLTHSLALDARGAMFAWGANRAGQLGIGGRENQASPLRVQGLARVQGIAAGALHSLALEANGVMKASGENESGQFGNGLSDNSDVFVNVNSSRADIHSVAAGGFHSLALTRDGALLGWGQNREGQLATGDDESQFEPVFAALNGVTLRVP